MIIILYSDKGSDIQKYKHYHIIYEDYEYISLEAITQSSDAKSNLSIGLNMLEIGGYVSV